jgi:diguanylate cyclase (GGDEF)-like protein
MSNKPVILVVDDARVNLQALAHILKDDYTIKIAMGGLEAIEQAQKEPLPDLILLDVGMPEVNGYDVCKILQGNITTVDIPIIFVTGKDSIEDEEYGLSLGAVDYITKPIRPVIVKARIKTHIALKQHRDELRAMATRDSLTGLYNRRYLTDALMSRVARANRHGDHLSVIMADVDYFKKINDTHGHLVGDEVLKAVAQTITEAARREDIVARFGGEEFVMVMDNCSLNDASAKAEELRQKIQLLHPNNLDVTVSFGVAGLSDTINDCTLLFTVVDKALYKAKNSGRNRVEVYREKV